MQLTNAAAAATVPNQHMLWQKLCYSTEAADATEQKKQQEPEEVVTGPEEVHEFKTETKRLLQIVANSLYSEKEIFVR